VRLQDGSHRIIQIKAQNMVKYRLDIDRLVAEHKPKEGAPNSQKKPPRSFSNLFQNNSKDEL